MRWAIAIGIVVALALGLYVLARPTEAPRSGVARDAAVRSEPVVGSPPSMSRDASEPRDAEVSDAPSGIDRTALVANMRESGAGREAWDDQGIALLRSIAPGHVDISDVGCYIAGCVATLTFPSMAEYQRDLGELQASDAYRAWTGGKRLSNPELSRDGRVVIAIALYRPD